MAGLFHIISLTFCREVNNAVEAEVNVAQVCARTDLLGKSGDLVIVQVQNLATGKTISSGK